MAFDALTSRLGTSQGRIRPIGFTAVGDYSLVLGSDFPDSVARLNPGNRISFSQVVDVTGMKYIRVPLFARPPTAMPVARTASDGSTNGAGTQLTSVAAMFVQADVGSVVRAAGQPDATITAVSGNTVTISPAWAGSLSGIIFQVLGAAWRFSLLVGGVERAAHTIAAGRARTRDLRANVSKLTGNQTVELRLELVAA